MLSRQTKPVKYLSCIIIFSFSAWLFNFSRSAESSLSEPVVKAVFYDEENNPSECSGVLIAHHKVLTAAHCINEMTFSGKVAVTGSEYRAVKIVKHPQFRFDGKVFHHDIAVLTIENDLAIDPAQFDSSVTPSVDERIHIYGFRLTSKKDEIMSNLQLRGGSMVASSIDGEFIHAKFDGTGHNSCVGDSGGPVFIERNGSFWLVGLVSSGTRKDCGAGDTSVFTLLGTEENLKFWQEQLAESSSR